MNSAIIVAAGSGTRMGGAQNKILLPLSDRPVILYSLITFQDCEEIDEIIIVARRSEFEVLHKIAEQNNITKLTAIVEGGATRQQSVEAGIGSARSGDGGFYFIHDAARPLLSKKLMDSLIVATNKHSAFTIGVRVKDTVKQAGESGEIIATPDRSSLWLIQTPQVFQKELYKIALEDAVESGLDFTDDCQLMEHIGIPAYIIEGSYSNIKITTPEDIVLAEALLKLEDK